MGKVSLTYYGLVALGQRVMDSGFEEADHPRDKDGQFAKGAGGSGGETKNKAEEITNTPESSIHQSSEPAAKATSSTIAKLKKLAKSDSRSGQLLSEIVSVANKHDELVAEGFTETGAWAVNSDNGIMVTVNSDYDKKTLNGLQSWNEKLISTTFTHGNNQSIIKDINKLTNAIIERESPKKTAHDDSWITAKPENGKGKHILLDPDGNIKGGLPKSVIGKPLGEGVKELESSKANKSPKKSQSQQEQHAEQAAEKPQTPAAATNKFGDAEKQGLQSYTLAGSYPINDYLRNGTPVDSGKYAGVTPIEDQEGLTDTVKRMDKAFENASLEKQTTTYRMVNNDAWAKIAAGAKPGAIIEDNGFVSTATNKESITGSGLSHTMTITVPAGYKAIALDGLVENRTNNELLLNRGTKFKVVSINKNNVTVEVVP